MKAFVFGDCHIGRYNHQQVTDESFGIWDWAEKYIAEVDIIIFLGDRFRSRDPEGSIRDIGDIGLWRIAKKKPVIAICGNHDFYYKHGSIENNYGVMKQIDNVTVVVDRAKVQLDGVNLEFAACGHQAITEGQVGTAGFFGTGKFTICEVVYRDWETDRKSTRLNSSHRL